MRLVRFDGGDGRARPGRLEGETVVDLSAAAPTMEALIAQGLPAAVDGPARALGAVRLLAPLRPASLRDFLAFEDHAKAGAARRGEDLNPAWYDAPVYYKGNHRSILGPGEPLPWPSFSERLDFELELACVIGARGRDLSVEQARDYVFGYTIMNDWSARDVQRAEMAMRLGPAKSKDFATSLGPCIVTADEFEPWNGLSMAVRVNDETWFETTNATMHWTFEQMIAHVSRDEDVFPCDVYGSGTAHRGCGLDLDRWIARGDVVELRIDGIGTLRTPVVSHS
ncbi:MAG TPA: fumarylacetoacetate hydrolase family protein [Actinomycetota bacterium]